MDNNNINTKFLAFLDYRNKFQDKSIADDILIKMIDGDNPLPIRSTNNYKKDINILFDNIDHMYRKSDLIGIYNEFDIEDFSEVFDKIKDKEKFVEGFLVFNDVKNIYTLDTKFQSVTDFFTIILKRDIIEQAIVKFSKEVNEILDTHKNDISKRVQELDQMLQKINEITFTSEAEKQNYGEVFTSLILINEMLDRLPKTIWKNPYLKWLDPANGYGNFPIVVIKRLMEGLEDVVIPETNLQDPELRYKWIMEKMIYVCDINIKNMKIYQELVDREKKLGIKLNYFRGSFLSRKFNDKMIEWNVKGFDIIMGNPPYDLVGATGDNKLYLDFSKKSMQLLNNSESRLLFITPKNILSYMLLCDKNRSYFSKFYQIDHLCIDVPSKYFKVGSTFLYFNILNKNYSQETSVTYLTFDNKEETVDLFLKKGENIPNKLSKIDLSIIEKIKSKKNQNFDFKVMKFNNKELRIRKAQITNGLVSKEKDLKYKYPVIDGINKGNPFPGKIYYSKLNMSDGKMKIVMNRSGYLCPSFDEKGNFFLSDNLISLEINKKDEFLNFKNIYDSDVFNYWLQQYRLNGFSDEKSLKTFPKLDLSRSWTNEDLYKYFNFSINEIEKIKNATEKQEKIEKQNIISNDGDGNFKVGKRYEYTGRSKTIKKGEVELVKILKTTFRIKDNIGNVLNVKKSTLKSK